jgi:hypothetical protein
MRPTTRREKIRTTKPNGFRGGGGQRLQLGLAIPALWAFRFVHIGNLATSRRQAMRSIFQPLQVQPLHNHFNLIA